MINIYNNNNKDMFRFEVLQNARKDLVGEIEAIIQYDNHLMSTNDSIAKQTWQNIMHEEMTHVGELMGIINYLNPSQKQYVEKGLEEFEERLNKMRGGMN